MPSPNNFRLTKIIFGVAALGASLHIATTVRLFIERKSLKETLDTKTSMLDTLRGKGENSLQRIEDMPGVMALRYSNAIYWVSGLAVSLGAMNNSLERKNNTIRASISDIDREIQKQRLVCRNVNAVMGSDGENFKNLSSAFGRKP
ncbi:hypothetical protein VTL71DRAFT_16536 [Oculimacula yallundae]|uniref:Uncharacterized protein n=1 Tax=Oculimacula yallundae TaxID=86028 RepID=A0ABR4CGY1_9HELO